MCSVQSTLLHHSEGEIVTSFTLLRVSSSPPLLNCFASVRSDDVYARQKYSLYSCIYSVALILSPTLLSQGRREIAHVRCNCQCMLPLPRHRVLCSEHFFFFFFSFFSFCRFSFPSTLSFSSCSCAASHVKRKFFFFPHFIASFILIVYHFACVFCFFSLISS